MAALADDGVPEALHGDAWFTGSLNSTGASALPAGHFLAEPYIGDVMERPEGGKASHTAQSLNLLLYGISDELTVGLIPRVSWHTHAEIGDLTARAQYRFTDYDEASGMPALAFVVNQDLPKGNGAYTTHLGLLADEYEVVDGRPLRLRLNLSYGFQDLARPGPAYDAVLAFEYSLSTRWAVAVDITYDRSEETRIAQSAGLVPALEYNWTAYTGLIIGVQLPIWQHAASRVTMPMAALNCVF